MTPKRTLSFKKKNIPSSSPGRLQEVQESLNIQRDGTSSSEMLPLLQE